METEEDKRPTPDEDEILLRMKQETLSNKTYNLLGGVTAGEELEAEMQFQGDSFMQTVGRAVADTPIPTAYNWAKRTFLTEDDPDFKLSEEEIKHIQTSYPERTWDKFSNVRSAAEFDLLRQDVEEEIEDEAYLANTSGFQGAAAGLIAATVDPINYLPLKASFLGYKASKLARPLGQTAQGTAYGAAAGLEATALSIGVTETLSPTGNLDEALPALGYGLAFGGAAGVAGAFDSAIANSAKKFADEYPTQRKAGPMTSDDFDQTPNLPEEVRTSGGWFSKVKEAVQGEGTLKAFGSDGTIKAAGANVTPGNVTDLAGLGILDADLQLISKARKFNKNWQITDDDLGLKGHPVGNFVYNNLQKLPFMRTLSDIGLNSGSAIHRMLAFQTLNNSAGIANNVQSVGLMAHKMEMQIGGPIIQALEREYPNWLKENNLTRSASNWRKFRRAVQAYDAEMYYSGGVQSLTSSRSKALASVYEHGEYSARAGREWLMDTKYGKTPVRGSENLSDAPGWRPLRWNYGEMSRVMKAKGIKEKDLIESLADGYRKVHPWMTDDALKIWAKAVIRRSKALDGGIDTNLIRFLDQDGEAYARQVLMDSGVSEKKATRLIKALQDRKPSENTVKILQHRKEIDLRTPIRGTDLTLMDLTDPDLGNVWSSYSRTASFAGAQARWGLQKGDVKKLIEAGNRELEAQGKPPMQQSHMEAWERAISGQAMNQANPWSRRMAMASNLTLMNTQGLTQLADTGVAVAHFGGKVYLKALKETLKKVDTPALKELARVNKSISGEHNFKLTEKQLDDWNKDANYQMELERHLDALLVKGSKIQAVISGFEVVHKSQHEIVARSYLHQFGDMAKGVTKLAPRRLEDMGFYGNKGKAKYDQIMKNFDPNTGIVKYDADGDVYDLNVNAWDPELFDFFTATQQHVSHQLTMQLMRGENMPWQTNGDFGYLISNLRGYTLAAISKQTVRHLRVMDPVATATWMYSFLSALTVVAARNAISGKENKMDTEDMVRSALGLGSMTGGPSMLPDMLGAMLGIDALQVSAYRMEGPAGQRVLPEIIALGQMEKLLHIPVSALSVATGNYSKQDISAIQATPLFGNLYGFTWMFNGMKAEVDARKTRGKAAAKKAKETPAKEETKPTVKPEAKEKVPEKTFRVNPNLPEEKKAAVAAFIKGQTGDGKLPDDIKDFLEN